MLSRCVMEKSPAGSTRARAPASVPLEAKETCRWGPQAPTRLPGDAT